MDLAAIVLPNRRGRVLFENRKGSQVPGKGSLGDGKGSQVPNGAPESPVRRARGISQASLGEGRQGNAKE